MKLRGISATVVFVSIMALAAEGFAIAKSEVKKVAISRRPVSHLKKVEIKPGPCGWFAPENCPEYERMPNPEGCTEERMELIDERSAGYPVHLYIGAPASGYMEIDGGCKRDFEQGTIYVPYRQYGDEYTKVLCGPILDLYLSLGESSSALGWPQSRALEKPHYSSGGFVIKEISATALAAVDYEFEALAHRYEFANGWVYWHPDYETPRIVMDRIHDLFEAEGGTPVLGFPCNDETLDSHEGAMLFQAFDTALIFENIYGELEIFRDEMLDAYLDGASEYGVYPVDDPIDAEAELGLPMSDYLPTPNGSVRLLHSGTIYYRDGEPLQVFPGSIAMLDGRVVDPEAVNPAFGTDGIVRAIEEDPYLADYRKEVVLEAVRHEGLCGDAARDAIGTISTEYCSEFVREIYIAAGVDSGLWGGGIYLWSVTYARQLRWIFQHESRFVYARDADLLTAEPGDYLSMHDEGHSALVVATSIDGRRLWRVGGNEGDRDCVVFSRTTYFDGTGAINRDFYGFGKLDASFF